MKDYALKDYDFEKSGSIAMELITGVSALVCFLTLILFLWVVM